MRGRFSLSVRKRVVIVDRFGERLIRSRRHVDCSPEEVVIEEDGLLIGISARSQLGCTSTFSSEPHKWGGERCL